MADNAYQDCLATMYSLHRFGIKLGLDTIKSILAALGNPERNFKCIHIAGTNGKGSVAAMLSTILHAAGYSVGRYTSPHLEHFNERICINETPIDDAAVLEAHKRVDSVQGLSRQPTFFEFTTAMALDVFGRRHVDWGIIETGMGGRLDATNVIQPELTVITNISLEHKSYLGGTIAAIAGEKAGIIKPNIPLVTGVGQKSARTAIFRQAADKKARVYLKGKDFRYRRQNRDQFTYYGMKHRWQKLSLSLSGAHQFENASLVLAACEILRESGQASIPERSIEYGLGHTRWPGRLEVVCTRPHLILDGAHNLMAARTLARYLTEQFKNHTITLVVGILDDKPYEAILKDLIAPCKRVIVTQPVIDRAIAAPLLAAMAEQYSAEVDIIPDVGQAVRHALEISTADDVICVAGSLYVVGEAKTALAKMGLG